MSNAEVVKGATIIATVGDSSPSSSSTYAIQMTECQTCTKNTATINTMLTVMQQQATTLKDQQGTIANLITMLSNATGGTAPAKVASSTVTTRSAVGQANLTTSGKRSHHKKRASPEPPQEAPTMVRKRVRTKPTAIAASSTPKRKVIINGDGESEENGLPVEFIVKHDRPANSEGDDDGLVTKIWIRGTPNEKCRCPLDECADRKFAAADMYYLRRHFQQVHRLTHPNPMFVVQCPVEECSAEFEQSLREMRKHLSKDHPDIYSSSRSPSKHSAADIELAEEEADGAGEDAEAAAELASEEDV